MRKSVFHPAGSLPFALGLVVALSMLPSKAVLAVEPAFAFYNPGLYLGASVGQSWVEADVDALGSPEFGSPQFRRYDTGYKVMLGVRPLPFLGAEVEYIDLGDAHGGIDNTPLDVRMRGGAAYGVLYLPVPIPTVDIFGKVGASRFQSVIEGGQSFNCVFSCGPSFRETSDTTGLALGAGVQFKLGPVAIRTEYEHFNAAGGSPSLASVGATWTFY
jgi:opacity protein-like surface antigen